MWQSHCFLFVELYSKLLWCFWWPTLNHFANALSTCCWRDMCLLRSNVNTHIMELVDHLKVECYPIGFPCPTTLERMCLKDFPIPTFILDVISSSKNDEDLKMIVNDFYFVIIFKCITSFYIACNAAPRNIIWGEFTVIYQNWSWNGNG